MRETFRYLIRADTAPLPGGVVSDWFTILKAGEWSDPRYGKLTVTRADLENAVANFAKFQESRVEVPIDYDHSFAQRGDSRAAGWYVGLRVRGDNLEAQAKWTAVAAEAIRKGEYRYFSSEYDEDYSHSDFGDRLGFTILSGGLTNRPAVKGLGTVALGEHDMQVIGEPADANGGYMGARLEMSPGRFLTDPGTGVTLADPQLRERFLRLAEDNNKLNEVVEEIVRAQPGKTFHDALGEVLAVIEATREREELDEPACDPERLELADRLQARALREGITLSEAIEREELR